MASIHAGEEAPELIARLGPSAPVFGNSGQDPPWEKETPIYTQGLPSCRLGFLNPSELQENLGSLCAQAPYRRVALQKSQ
jgi:hypothetical protein